MKVDGDDDCPNDKSSEEDDDGVEVQENHGSTTKPLNRNDLKRMFDEILGSYD